MFNIIILGPPNSGKSTQSKNIYEVYKYLPFSMGNILRKEIADQSPVGLRVESYVEKGILVPHEIIQELVLDNFGKVSEGIGRGLIFDGYPRNNLQFETLLSILQKKNSTIHLILVLNVPEKQWIRRANYRLKNENRIDDKNKEVVKSRFALYYNETLPLLEVAKKNNVKIVNIDVTWSDEFVFKKIKKQLDILIN